MTQDNGMNSSLAKGLSRQKAEGVLAHLLQTRILVVGDLMLDEYLWGNTERISPEAPVQVVDVRREDFRLGGAGNVVNNLLRLGCRVEVASVAGDDADGRRLVQRLVDLGLTGNGVYLSPERTTTRKTRVLSSNQQMLRIDRENRQPLSSSEEQSLLDRLEKLLAKNYDAILVSDYLKGVLTNEVLSFLITRAHELRIPVVVDPKGRDFVRYRGATLLTPNRKEIQIAAGRDLRTPGDLDDIGRTLCRELDLKALVVTRSEEGMSVYCRDGDEYHLPTEALSGAGDTVLAVIGAGLAAGLEIQDAARLSNLAAGVVVGKVGTSTVSCEEIIDAIAHQHQDTDYKIKDRAFLRDIIAEKKKAGQTIVFTNGCFDLLHVGHVKYLQKARQLGDLLVLGLNSDDSIRRLKGPKRPLISEEERSHILAALHCIDYVVLFPEDTPLELIREIEPHILVKGGDYDPADVVGRQVVESYGGRVEIISFVDGRSTTNIIDTILQNYSDL